MRATIYFYLDYLSKLLANKKSYEIISSIILLFMIIFLTDKLFKFILTKVLKKIINNSNFNWYKLLYEKKAFHSFAHFLSFGLGFSLSHFLLQNLHSFIYVVDKIFTIAITFIFFQLLFRLIDVIGSISNQEQESYKTVGYRTFAQFLKIITILIGFIVVISLLFNVSLNTIVTSISAITAILLLIFRDTIVGLVSGIQISASKIMKIGDWIFIEKYNLEGFVKEINLTSTKIESTDKSISSVPTYDLLSSKLTNYQPILDSNKRKIKRSIYFNVNSFVYIDKEKQDVLRNKFSVLNSYFEKKIINLNFSVTNIELFQVYCRLHLENHPNVTKSEIISIKLLPIITNSVPLEISYFLITSNLRKYEENILEVLSHLIIVSREFELQILQTEK